MNKKGTVLWWGRFDPDYSRNRVLRQAFDVLGWQIVDFRPKSSMIGDLEALLAKVQRPDLIWVPSFRQRDVAAARRWADKKEVPLVFDPLISAYDKQVNEKHFFAQNSFRARRLLRTERKLFQSADYLIADTCVHSEYFHSQFTVPERDIHVVPVGAEEGLFKPLTRSARPGVVEVLFYGSFIELQGPQVIVEAAAECKAQNVVWTLLGDGPLRRECESLASRKQLKNISFENWIDYKLLPERIGQADILLGVFGISGKASRVIPNKVYQSLACGRPVITRTSTAYPERFLDNQSTGLTQINPGSGSSLANAVERYAASPELIVSGNVQARETYETFFSSDAIRNSLQTLLSEVFP